MGLRFDTDAGEADWIREGMAPDWWATVLLGPPGFEAYARVLGLPDPQYPDQSEGDIDDAVIDAMPADDELIVATVDALRASTGTPDDLRFLLCAVWPYTPALPKNNRIDLAGVRECVLASGTLTQWSDWAEGGQERWFPPAFTWPADRSWCLAYDVDSHFIGVAGTQTAIDHLLATSAYPVQRSSRDHIPGLYG